MPGLDPHRKLHPLHEGLDEGYDLAPGEEHAIRAAKGEPLYGELTPRGTEMFLDALDLGRSDVFFDLGCGTGKIVLLAAMSAPLRRCVGIELSPTRCQIARKALRRARGLELIEAKRCSISRENLLETNLSAATVVYCCSTAFSTALMNRLSRKLLNLDRDLLYATLQEPDPRRGMEEIGKVSVPTTWDRHATIHLYWVSAGHARPSTERRKRA